MFLHQLVHFLAILILPLLNCTKNQYSLFLICLRFALLYCYWFSYLTVIENLVDLTKLILFFSDVHNLLIFVCRIIFILNLSFWIKAIFWTCFLKGIIFFSWVLIRQSIIWKFSILPHIFWSLLTWVRFSLLIFIVIIILCFVVIILEFFLILLILLLTDIIFYESHSSFWIVVVVFFFFVDILIKKFTLLVMTWFKKTIFIFFSSLCCF